MPFKPIIPQPTDFISQSQKDIIGNFETLYDVWGKTELESENIGDHVPLNAAKEDDHGAHKKLTFPEQAAEPVPGANEINLFSQDDGGETNLYYRRDADAAGHKLTSDGAPLVGGLVLRAFVVFDFQGNIIEREELDDEGNTIKVPLSFNIESITPNVPLVDGKNEWGDWTITFKKALPTQYYFWDYRAFSNDTFGAIRFIRGVQAQPFNSAVYGLTATPLTFRASSAYVVKPNSIPNRIPVKNRLDRMIFHAYTVG